jgi:chromosome segregation ATPase
MAAKNIAQKAEKADSLALSSGVPSRTGSPVTVNESPRRSLDVASTEGGEKESTGQAEQTPNTAAIQDDIVAAEPKRLETMMMAPPAINGNLAKAEVEHALRHTPRPSTDSTTSSLPRASTDSMRQAESVPRSSTDVPPIEMTEPTSLKRPAEYEAILKQMQSDYETAELQRQEEVHEYIERIDALQSKLQYLAKESAETARKAGASAPTGSLEKKLADKEEQVALLMEEGQKLSKKELTHLSTLKKLRSKIAEDGKELTEAKRKTEKAEKDALVTTERWKKAEASEKRLNERLKLVPQLQKDIESLKSERDAKDFTIADLKKQLEEAIAGSKEAETKIAHEALEVEKKRVSELEDDLANLKIEKSLVSDRAQAQIKELREKMDKDSERARIAELEMKTEQQMLESKLEVTRARAEEVSSGATGDAQAKLLRQIETLQTQYAVASENWQGIEASLIARATNLEKERDEATRREADIRRKAREVVCINEKTILRMLTQGQTLKAKRNEEELEETRSKLPTFQQELAEQKSKFEALQQRAEEAESALIEARASFEQEKQTWSLQILQRVEEEKQKWQEEAGNTYGYNNNKNNNRAESPVTSTRRGLTTEFLGLQNLQLRRASRSINNDSPTTSGFLGRRPSATPLGRSSGNGTPARQDSVQSLKENGADMEKASIHTDNDEFFENHASPSSPHQTINDMVSASTVGAGPSVQLVERMSSAVRRLESEKAATKEDLARLSAQRDEARAEIVALVREVEEKRAADAKVAKLEAEIQDINSRYQTTLEMLGEKSELVDELKSDIDDIKAMYRELVERTVK